MTPEAGDVRLARPNWLTSRVPAQSFVVVRLLTNVCAFAVLTNNAKRITATHTRIEAAGDAPSLVLFCVVALLMTFSFPPGVVAPAMSNR
jgi:uncharacterized membrane protein YdjX (TVP38/TMEM64 family)